MIEADQQLPTLGRLARRTLSTFIGALQNRAELFAVEFEEENDRIMKLVMFGICGMFFGMMGMMLITAAIIFLMPEPDRVYATFGFAVLYLAGAAVVGFKVKDLLKQAPFSESLNQIKKDAEILEALK
jgi:uncharacterized membrane protein YqjE